MTNHPNRWSKAARSWSEEANAIAFEHDGRDWSEAETAYGGGGNRIDRERLAKYIAYALARAFGDGKTGR